MAKNIIVCEVLSTVKGLDPRAPQDYTHAGTVDQPTLIELPDNGITAGIIATGAIRIYPGPQAALQVSETDKVKALQAKLAELEKSLLDAAATAEKLTAALRKIETSADIESAVIIVKEALA